MITTSTTEENPMTSPTILVTGATGTVGSALIPQLLARGVRVRAMTRNPGQSATGYEIVLADFNKPETLVAALDGIDALFLNSPSTEHASELQIRCAELAESLGVPRIVLLSQFGARLDSSVRFLRWHAEVENHLHGLELTGTVLRPNLYLQSLLTFSSTIARGTLTAPIGHATVSAIDTRDLAEVAATVLSTPGHENRTYTLTGPRAITHADIALAIATATNSPVVFRDVTEEEFASALENFLPAWQLHGLLEDYAHYKRGEATEVTTTVEDLIKRRPRDVTDFARDHALAFTQT